MKILFVSAVYPPQPSATAGILDNLIQQFKAVGCQVDVLTVKKSLKDSSFSEANGSKIYYANYSFGNVPAFPIYLPDLFNKLKRRLLVKKKKNSSSAGLYEKDMVKAFLKRMNDIDMQSYDAVISVCAFYGAAEAVATYKDKYGIMGKTVLYQVDPLADNMVYSCIPQTKRESFENRVFSSHDVIFTTPVIYSNYCGKKYFEKMIAVEFPYVTEDEIEDASDAKMQDDEIKLLFAGHIYPQIRNPHFLLELLSKMNAPNVKLYIIGNGMYDMTTSYQNGGLKDRLIRLGAQPTEFCKEWFEKADVLVNISNSVPNQVPSKIFEYISLGKPILNIYKLENSPCLAYLGEYPLAINVFEGKDNGNITDDLAEDVYEKIKAVLGKRIPKKQIMEQYKHCTPKYVADKMLEAIQEL